MAKEDEMLKVWCNGYEAVAAEDEAGARARDEENRETEQTVGDVLAESPEPRHLWSCEV